MPRIAENQLIGVAVNGVQLNRQRIAKYSSEVSTGLKVTNPGDSNLSGSISQFKESLSKVDGYRTRISTVKSALIFQDDVFTQAEEIMIRAKELAEQAANESNGVDARRHMAEEALQLRDHLVSLGNSTYQGRYIFGGTRDDDPPFDLSSTPYTNPASGAGADHYVHDGLAGRSDTKNVNITDNLAIEINTDGASLFNTGIEALERLSRSLLGFQTNPAVGTPDGSGNAYTFPTDFAQQTLDIKATMGLLDSAREDDFVTERTAIGGKLRRLDTAQSLLDLTKVNTEELLDKLQNADIVESSSNLAQAQTALEASFAVTSKILSLSILDYI